MNSTIAKLADEFEKMEKTIASQKKMIETLMPTGYVDTDTVKLHLNSVYGVMFGGRPLRSAASWKTVLGTRSICIPPSVLLTRCSRSVTPRNSVWLMAPT